jgi:mannose-1-phosphate guanylyltransferase/mannose-6-phosphate isomerase
MIRPVILCGGAGTRLWPVSREKSPKQFLSLMGEKSLLQQTAERLSGERFQPAIVVSGEEQRHLIEAQLQGSAAVVEAILLEPTGRNTAAAAALAAEWLDSTGGDELLLLMPSDHVIGDRASFVRAIDIGAPHAEAGAIVTFGAQPSEPNTQYGYIEAQPVEGSADGAYPIARFHEKPNAQKAAEYLASGRFFWNCGIFLAKASTILHEIERFLPESANAISAAVERGAAEGLFFRPSADSFAQVQNISIDHAIMEKTSLGVVVPVQMQWSDVGAWDAVWKLGEKDADGNVTHGDVVTLDSRNSLLRSDGRAMIAAIGLQDIAVIAVDDAILVAPLDRVAEVKELLAKMKDPEAVPTGPMKGRNRRQA